VKNRKSSDTANIIDRRDVPRYIVTILAVGRFVILLSKSLVTENYGGNLSLYGMCIQQSVSDLVLLGQYRYFIGSKQ
jgi:hypothetical protein